MGRMTDDLWEAVFSILDPRSVLHCAQVNQRFNRIITRSTALQLNLHRHLLNSALPSSSKPSYAHEVPVLEELRNLIQMEKNFTEFTPRHDTLIIGPNERFRAAYHGKVITMFDRVLRAGDREEGKWKAMVEYTEHIESGKSTWERKEHIWDFRPDTPDLTIDLERDLVVVQGVSDNHQTVIRVISLAEQSCYCEAIHINRMASSMLFGPLDTIVLVAKPKLHVYSLIDGQQKITINLPPGVTQRHRAHYVWPNCILFSANTTERWPGTSNSNPGLEQRIFIYDLAPIILSNPSDTVTINAPTYTLIYPREILDLPPHIHNKISEICPADQPQPSMKGYISGFHQKNGIIPIHVRISPCESTDPTEQGQHISIYIDLIRLLRNRFGSQTIRQADWYPFSYIHFEDRSVSHISEAMNSLAGNLKLFGWTKLAPSGEMTLWYHDLNQRLCRYSGSGELGIALGGMGGRLGLEDAAMTEDHNENTPLSDIAMARSEVTPGSLGATTRTAVYRSHGDVESRPTTFFDGTRLFFQNAKQKNTVSILDWR